jgi:hypothetical protein
MIEIGKEIADFNSSYESLHNSQNMYFVRLRAYRLDGDSVDEDFYTLIATDMAHEHHGVSVTNRVERIMYLAWERFGRPKKVRFIEHYERHRDTFSKEADTFDEVFFEKFPELCDCICGGKLVGKQFRHPTWKSMRDFRMELCETK